MVDPDDRTIGLNPLALRAKPKVVEDNKNSLSLNVILNSEFAPDSLVGPLPLASLKSVIKQLLLPIQLGIPRAEE